MLDSDDGPDYVNLEGTVLESPKDHAFYRNCYMQHVPSYLQDHLLTQISTLHDF